MQFLCRLYDEYDPNASQNDDFPLLLILGTAAVGTIVLFYYVVWVKKFK